MNSLLQLFEFLRGRRWKPVAEAPRVPPERRLAKGVDYHPPRPTEEEAGALGRNLEEGLEAGDRERCLEVVQSLSRSALLLESGAQRVAARWPETRPLLEAELGAACFLRREHDRALWHYLAARQAGYDEGVIDDRLFELAEALAFIAPDEPGRREAYMRYKTFSPKGRYLEALLGWEAWLNRQSF